MHFEYNGFGIRLADGKDYPEGYYSFDVHTGNAHWFSKINADNDNESYLLTAYDSRRIVLLGDGDSSRGYQLVSSEGEPPDMVTTFLEPGKDKVLCSFSTFTGFARDVYELHGRSPDGRYVLVMRDQAVMFPEREIYTYYLVDVTSGQARPFLKDTKNIINGFYWVGGND